MLSIKKIVKFRISSPLAAFLFIGGPPPASSSDSLVGLSSGSGTSVKIGVNHKYNDAFVLKGTIFELHDVTLSPY